MSNYEKPNYTQIPNALLDEHLPHMKEAELRVVLVIARATFGWHKQKDKLSISQLVEKTGLTRQGVVNGIGAAMDRGVIGREEDGMGFVYFLTISDEPVNVVDQSTKLTSQRSGPKPVNVVDRKVVNVVDTQKKDIKEIERKGDAALSQTDEPAPPSEAFSPPRKIRQQAIPSWMWRLSASRKDSKTAAVISPTAVGNGRLLTPRFRRLNAYPLWNA